jgi:hypothetical protein
LIFGLSDRANGLRRLCASDVAFTDDNSTHIRRQSTYSPTYAPGYISGTSTHTEGTDSPAFSAAANVIGAFTASDAV